MQDGLGHNLGSAGRRDRYRVEARVERHAAGGDRPHHPARASASPKCERPDLDRAE
jgi:hypothetical protein